VCVFHFGVNAQTEENIRLSSFEDSLSFALGIESALDLYRNYPIFENLDKESLVLGFQRNLSDKSPDGCAEIMKEFLGVRGDKFDTSYLKVGSECVGRYTANDIFKGLNEYNVVHWVDLPHVLGGFKQGVYRTYESNLSNLAKKELTEEFGEIMEQEFQALIAFNDSVFWSRVLQIEGIQQVGETGIYIEVLKKGSGGNPTRTSDIEAEYIYMSTTGDTLQSTFEFGQSTKLNLGSVIEGWREGFTVMQKGGIYRLYIPYEKAYKNSQYQSAPKGALHYYIELIDFGPKGTIAKQIPSVVRRKHE